MTLYDVESDSPLGSTVSQLEDQLKDAKDELDTLTSRRNGVRWRSRGTMGQVHREIATHRGKITCANVEEYLKRLEGRIRELGGRIDLIEEEIEKLGAEEQVRGDNSDEWAENC